MANHKIGRLSEDIKREISALFRELKDPRISPLLSVVRCEVSNDLSHCKVHVSALDGEDATKTSVEGLRSASGFLKRELSNRLHLRKCPELHFIADGSIAYSAKINQILHQLDLTDENSKENEEEE